MMQHSAPYMTSESVLSLLSKTNKSCPLMLTSLFPFIYLFILLFLLLLGILTYRFIFFYFRIFQIVLIIIHFHAPCPTGIH